MGHLFCVSPSTGQEAWYHKRKQALEVCDIMEQRPNLLTLDAAANLLKVGAPSVQSLINRGILTSQIRDGQTVVSYDDILRFLREDQRHLLEEDGQSPDLGLMSGDAAE